MDFFFSIQVSGNAGSLAFPRGTGPKVYFPISKLNSRLFIP